MASSSSSSSLSNRAGECVPIFALAPARTSGASEPASLVENVCTDDAMAKSVAGMCWVFGDHKIVEEAFTLSVFKFLIGLYIEKSCCSLPLVCT